MQRVKVIKVNSNEPKLARSQYVHVGNMVRGIIGADLRAGERAKILYIREHVRYTLVGNFRVSEFWAAVEIIKSNNPHTIGLQMNCLAHTLRPVAQKESKQCI